MRILGFSKRWQKLSNPEFTTFRFRRRDRDWAPGELVQVVYKPRSKDRQVLGTAEILSSERRWVLNAEDNSLKHHCYCDYFGIKEVTGDEAIEDGFKNRADMVHWIGRAHRLRNLMEPMNKLTLRIQVVK